MASLFNKNTAAQKEIHPGVLINRYRSARHNLLLVIIFSAINILLLATNSGYYFLFSAFVPYILVDYGMFFCGFYPAEYYDEFYPGMSFLDGSYMSIFAVVAVVILALYLLSWIFSKKNRVGWLIFSLVLFVIDTVAMLYMIVDFSEYIFDIIFHAWVIISLIMGIVSHFKLKKMPEAFVQEDVSEVCAEQVQEPIEEEYSEEPVNTVE